MLTLLKIKQQFPNDFVVRYPKEAALILSCLATDPLQRPAAQEILDSEILDQDAYEIVQRITEENVELLRTLSEKTAESKCLEELALLQAEKIRRMEEELRFYQELDGFGDGGAI